MLRAVHTQILTPSTQTAQTSSRRCYCSDKDMIPYWPPPRTNAKYVQQTILPSQKCQCKELKHASLQGHAVHPLPTRFWVNEFIAPLSPTLTQFIWEMLKSCFSYCNSIEIASSPRQKRNTIKLFAGLPGSPSSLCVALWWKQYEQRLVKGLSFTH